MADTHDFPIPPANFLFLVESILMQAQVQLGLLNFGENDERPEPNLPLARHSIDLLAMLQEKTKGNLASDEQRLLENGLTELRFRFVQVSDELSRAHPASTSTQNAAAASDRGPLIVTADGGKGTKTE
ncbi:MAG TPA: DUF1844 domain-containing protein [Bryobacteraceae bacterium]|jgi:hypothetical protein|nr:DUF1844 domain-containing protein [Bryobacteraceae bacterium]